MNQHEWIDHIPEVYQGNYKKAVGIGQNPSKAEAIKAKCLDCVNWERTEVRDCTAKNCPLWTHRPYAIKNKR